MLSWKPKQGCPSVKEQLVNNSDKKSHRGRRRKEEHEKEKLIEKESEERVKWVKRVERCAAIVLCYKTGR